jgi:hypothetical protein
MPKEAMLFRSRQFLCLRFAPPSAARPVEGEHF